MLKRLRLIGRSPVATAEDRCYRLRKPSTAGPEEGEALSFLFESNDSVVDEESLGHRVRLFKNEAEARKGQEPHAWRGRTPPAGVFRAR